MLHRLSMFAAALFLTSLAACVDSARRVGGGAADAASDGAFDLASAKADLAARPGDLASTPTDLASTPTDLAATPNDLAPPPQDLAKPADLAKPPADLATAGVITGGPCASGATGATAFRVAWTNAGGQATVSYEVHGLPDKSRWKVGAYGYNIGFKPAYVDTFLGPGGLQLDGSDFIDVELSTVGVAQIQSVTLAIFGRSYNTTASGSFNWQTFVNTGASPKDLVSNVAPYQWYRADATSAFAAGDGKALLRIKAGPSSGALVVNRFELCMQAN